MWKLMFLERKSSVYHDRDDEDSLLENEAHSTSKRRMSLQWPLILNCGVLVINVVILALIFLHDNKERLNYAPQLLYCKFL